MTHTRILTLTFLTAALVLLLLLGGAPIVQAAPASAHAPVLSTLQTGDLNEEEVEHLLWMREEEKVARDAYLALADKWGLQIFTNISKSEQQHMDTMLDLIVSYGLEDPVGDNPRGVFTNPDLQALYDALLAQGEQSLAEALKVGATIEEVDIIDLQKAIAITTHDDVTQAYEMLQCGSGNHLRAFVRNYESTTGETYTPQYLDQATYDSIMAGSQGGCGLMLNYRIYQPIFFSF